MNKPTKKKRERKKRKISNHFYLGIKLGWHGREEMTGNFNLGTKGRSLGCVSP